MKKNNFLKLKKKNIFGKSNIFQKRSLISYNDMIKTNSHQTAQNEIIESFFGPLPEYNSKPISGIPNKWYTPSLKEDTIIKNKFGEYTIKALNSNLDIWHQTPMGSLALIVLLDQYTRQIFRDTARAFEGDQKAVKLCLDGIEKDYPLQLNHPLYQLIYYHPLMHSENKKMQNLSIECFQKIVDITPAYS
eukprot:TRINITY_DN2322_c0_g2_i1.p1 TRINITY_DN2322_c0_g2~~TRINITY_DN2322_c0_g2_i1.p1  ORF type:complete len:207 (+),score=33.63 TRINITY_DN2322_c0_g2_i1:54-623(+)